jgi:hypothetical protein
MSYLAAGFLRVVSERGKPEEDAPGDGLFLCIELGVHSVRDAGDCAT